VEIADYITANTSTFLFVLIRTASILMVAPVFGALMIPGRVKMGLVFAIAMLLTPVIGYVPMPVSMVSLVISIAGEVLIGAAIGLVIRFVFIGVEFSGQLASFGMGLSMASMYDPVNATQITVIGRFMSIMMLLIFLAVNGHLMVIMALKKSFDVIPPYGFHLSGELAESMLLQSKEIFVLGVKFAAPMIAVLIFLNIAIGLMAKTVPQLNMFVVGFAVTILVGLLMLAFTLPVYETAIIAVIDEMWRGVFTIIKVM
jgi:flagellar biosynthetic protein FliR